MDGCYFVVCLSNPGNRLIVTVEVAQYGSLSRAQHKVQTRVVEAEPFNLNLLHFLE